MPCAIIAFLSLYLSFLCFGLLVRTQSRPYGLCQRPYTLAYIKEFGSPILHVYACLLLCLISMLASLDLGFSTLDALSEFVVVWLHPTPTRPCLDVTIWDASQRCQLLYAYLSPFPLRAMICLPCLFVLPVGFICILTNFAYTSMPESWLLVCHPCFNTMKLWTSNPNLHLSLTNTTFCLFVFYLGVCLSTCLLTSLFLCLPCLSCLSALCHFHTLFLSFPSMACLLVSCLCLGMCTNGGRTHEARARFPRRKQKGARMQACRYKPSDCS